MATNPEGQRCGNCRFWRDMPVMEGGQFCVRTPPSVFFVPGSGMQGPTTISFFPGMKPEGWCGEWKTEAAGAGVVKPISMVHDTFGGMA